LLNNPFSRSNSPGIVITIPERNVDEKRVNDNTSPLLYTVFMPEDTFETWQEQVNQALVNRIGLGIWDVEDQPYWDMWDDGFTPSAAVNEVLENIGY